MKGCSGAEGQDKQMGGTTVYRDKVDEEDLTGQDKRIIQTVYMNNGWMKGCTGQDKLKCGTVYRDKVSEEDLVGQDKQIRRMVVPWIRWMKRVR
jgi:hypothetical protein